MLRVSSCLAFRAFGRVWTESTMSWPLGWVQRGWLQDGARANAEVMSLRHSMCVREKDCAWPRGVTVSTLDSESSDRGSNPREASCVFMPPARASKLCQCVFASFSARGAPAGPLSAAGTDAVCHEFHMKCSRRGVRWGHLSGRWQNRRFATEFRAGSVLTQGPLQGHASLCMTKTAEWAHGVVVSHPLRMRKALGSIPSVSNLFCLQVWVVENGAATQ